MKKARFTEEQIIGILREHEAGAATYEGDLRPFWPYLRFGQYVHVGHGATFGLGKFHLSEGGSVTNRCR